jgi:hypothetical protein
MKIVAASVLLLLSACGSHEETPSNTSNAITAVDPMANSMDGSAFQAVGDLMESPEAKAVMGGPAPTPPANAAAPTPPASATVPTTPPPPAP